MTHNSSINLKISFKNRLALSYALFISLALGALCFVINFFSGIFFTNLIKDNIAERSAEIVTAISGQYNPLIEGFDLGAIEAIGMYFVRAGYIVTVEDENGSPVWDARSCDMQCCVSTIDGIAARMKGHFGLSGEMRTERYPVNHGHRTVATVIIETYGPFFYSETETRFLASINRLLLIAGIVLTGLSIIISAALSRTIVQPILTAGEAAHQIARIYSDTRAVERPLVRIPDHYHTRELASLSRSINALAGELEKREVRQKQLTGDIAHELRTPLTSLQGTIEAMIDGVYAPGREHLENCLEEIIRLANLVKDLEILAALEWETISLNKTEFDLAKLLRVTAEQWKAAAHEKGIEITLHTQEAVITADYDRLKQVFINLLSNAVKYAAIGGGGSISISMEPAEIPGKWKVAIADTGIGIPEDEIPHIFERFYRADKSRSRNTGGAGIGLTIAAAIIRAHGGTIEAKSSPVGAVFTVFIDERSEIASVFTRA